jgi:hypothetical protein
MGFECLLSWESWGGRTDLSEEMAELRLGNGCEREAGHWKARWNTGVAAPRHTYSACAEAHGVCAIDDWLRTVKDADRAGLLPHDLFGG